MDGAGADSGGAADSGGEAGANESTGLTDTNALPEVIAPRYAGGFSWGSYQSRVGQFTNSMLRTPPASAELRERRHPFVLNAYLKNTLGVSVYQPTGYALPRALAGSGDQTQSVISDTQFVDPIDSAFSSQSPHLDSKPGDSAKSEQEGRLVKETDMRRRALHVSEGRADKYDYQG